MIPHPHKPLGAPPLLFPQSPDPRTSSSPQDQAPALPSPNSPCPTKSLEPPFPTGPWVGWGGAQERKSWTWQHRAIHAPLPPLTTGAGDQAPTGIHISTHQLCGVDSCKRGGWRGGSVGVTACQMPPLPQPLLLHRQAQCQALPPGDTLPPPSGAWHWFDPSPWLFGVGDTCPPRVGVQAAAVRRAGALKG